MARPPDKHVRVNGDRVRCESCECDMFCYVTIPSGKATRIQYFKCSNRACGATRKRIATYRLA